MARNKVKDWTREITEVEEWNKMIESEKLICVEIYSAWFGYCDVYTPVIDKIMQKFDEEKQQNTIWTRLNVAAMEKENNEEPLKLLEKYSKYESPKPLYVFIKNKEQLATVTEANGGRMKDVVTACINGEPVKEPEPEPVDDIKISSEKKDDGQNDDEKQGDETETDQNQNEEEEETETQGNDENKPDEAKQDEEQNDNDQTIEPEIKTTTETGGDDAKQDESKKEEVEPEIKTETKGNDDQ